MRAPSSLYNRVVSVRFIRLGKPFESPPGSQPIIYSTRFFPQTVFRLIQALPPYLCSFFMFTAAICFMDFTEHIQTRIVSISAAG